MTMLQMYFEFVDNVSPLKLLANLSKVIDIGTNSDLIECDVTTFF